MIVKINSDNDNLLDILFKNPNTDWGLYLKPLKNGHIVGNVVDKHNYEIVFQDGKDSYAAENGNQIDFQSYCSPIACLQVCDQLFGHILKSKQDYLSKNIEWLDKTQGELDTKECTIEVPSFYIDSHWYKNGNFLLSKYLDGITLDQQSECVFKLTIKAKSIFEALNILVVVCIFTHVSNRESSFLFIDIYLTQKLGRILTNVENVPYFVFYLFILKAVRSEKQFMELKPMFEEYLSKKGIEANLMQHSNYLLRVHQITKCLEKDIDVLDIGCGELTYYKRMMTAGLKADYYAVDTNPKFERLAESIKGRYRENNLNFYTSLDDFTSEEKVNIILTEVIEHNPLEEAKALINRALTYNFNKIVITTPNSEFNVFYAMADNKRHDDHYFEPTRAEFKALVEECCAGKKIDIEYFSLGDCLNGIQSTQGCVISAIQ